MESEPRGEVTLAELSSGWESLLQVQNMSQESAYRIRRLIDRALPLADKMFLKTIKGREMLIQCAQQTVRLRDELESHGERLHKAMTELEKTYEDLLKKTHEFRVKAG
jgi:DnaJ-domain-containing protein 1